jgi:formylglycine-generating enzyme required for sulfatase activity
MRGGSWGGFASYCRSVFRNHLAPGYRNNDVGVRVAAVRPATT